MNLIRVIPFLTLSEEGLVKTTAFKNRRYIGDPINAVKVFNDKEADEICLLDIDATRFYKEPDYDRIEKIVSEAFMPVTYGGGVNSLKHFERLFSIGIEKVAVNSCIFENPSVIEEAINLYGSQSVVASIDIKKNFLGKFGIYSSCGRKKQKINFPYTVKLLTKIGFGECILNCIHKDGKMNGYELEVIKYFSNNLRIPVVSLGGAGSFKDLKSSVKAGSSGVGASSFFIFRGERRAVLISYLSEKEILKLSS